MAAQDPESIHQARRRRQQVVHMTDRRKFVITPSTLRLLTHSIFGHGGGGWTDLPRLPRALMIVSLDFDFAQFSFRLFVAARSSMCAISAKHDLELAAGTIRYVSLAYLMVQFAGVTGWKSAAVTTYDAGPSAEPCMTLAFTCATDEH